MRVTASKYKTEPVILVGFLERLTGSPTGFISPPRFRSPTFSTSIKKDFKFTKKVGDLSSTTLLILMPELAIIQKTYDLIKWYVPILNRLPREHKFQLGNRIVETLYKFLESLIEAKYSKQKQAKLENLNISLSILRHQTRLLFDFELFSTQRYEYVSKQIDEIGIDLGGWLKQLQKKSGEIPRRPIPTNR
jgi:hypothetical protein